MTQFQIGLALAPLLLLQSYFTEPPKTEAFTQTYTLGGIENGHILNRTLNRIIGGDSLATLANQASVRRAVIPRERGTSDLQGGDISAIIARYFPEAEQKTALAIAWVESGHNLYAHNYTPATKDDSYCWFQINLWGENKYSRPSPEVLMTPDGCAGFARKLYDADRAKGRSGWTDWTTYRSGAYKYHLNRFSI